MIEVEDDPMTVLHVRRSVAEPYLGPGVEWESLPSCLDDRFRDRGWGVYATDSIAHTIDLMRWGVLPTLEERAQEEYVRWFWSIHDDGEPE